MALRGFRKRSTAAHLAAVLVALVFVVPANGGRLGMTITIVTPTDGLTVSGAIPWQAAVAGGSPKRVEFLIDGRVKWRAVQPPYVFNGDGNTLDTTTLRDGKHTLEVDASGDRGDHTSATVSIVVANAPVNQPPSPTPPPSAPQPLQISTTAPTNGQTISGAVPWMVAVSGGTATKVDFSVDGVIKWTDVMSPYAFGPAGALDTTTLANGSHTLRATATGAAGTTSTSVSVTVANGSGFATDLVQGGSIALPFRWTFSPGEASVEGYFSADGKLVAQVSGSGPYALTLAAGALTDGSHQLAVSWGTPDGRRHGPVTVYVVTVSSGTTTTPGTVGSKLPSRLAESSGGTTLFVAPTGFDGSSCTLSAPCASLDRAFGLATAGTIIEVRGGTYSGEQTLRDRSFDASNPVTIVNYGSESPLLTGDPSSDHYGYPALFLFNVRGVRVRGLAVSNPNGDGVDVVDSTDVELDELYVHGNGVMGIYVGGITNGSAPTYSKNVQIWDSRLTMNGGKFPGDEAYAPKGTHSIYYGGGPLDGNQHGAVGGVIANNVIYDQATGRGIQLGQSAQGTIVTSNTIYNAYQSGFGTDAGDGIVLFNDGASNYPSRDVMIVDNLITNAYAFAVYGSCSSSMTSNRVFSNLAFANGAGDYDASYGNSCSLFTLGQNAAPADPLFVDPSGHDFRLRSNSPAVGVADPAYAPPTDITGKSRGSTPDIGAFQH